MEQIRDSIQAGKTNESNHSYKKRTQEEKENALSYQEELRKAKEEQLATERKRQEKRREPLSQEGATVSRKSAEEMLGILAMFSEMTN